MSAAVAWCGIDAALVTDANVDAAATAVGEAVKARERMTAGEPSDLIVVAVPPGSRRRYEDMLGAAFREAEAAT